MRPRNFTVLATTRIRDSWRANYATAVNSKWMGSKNRIAWKGCSSLLDIPTCYGITPGRMRVLSAIMIDLVRFPRASLIAGSFLLTLALERSGYAQSVPPPAGDAQVTFYSNPISLSGGLTARKPAAFRGRIFDGDHQLAFLVQGRFVTFAFPSGIHEFSAAPWFNQHESPGAHLVIDVESGHQYFIECGATTFGPPILIRESACAVVQPIGSKLKPLEAAHLRPDGKQLLVPGTSFPQCP
jgi:hypothetical protein